MFSLIIILALGVICLVYFIGIYNGLVGLRESVKTAWANIDVLLKQRHDELPKLIESCKRYMQFEEETFERVLRARGAISQASATGDVAALSAGEQQLRAGMGRLFAVAERYALLKSDESFKQLQSRITGIEAAIADRRELYNEQVNLNNIRVSVRPAAMLARWCGFKPAHSLDFPGDQTRDVDVGTLFRA